MPLYEKTCVQTRHKQELVHKETKRWRTMCRAGNVAAIGQMRDLAPSVAESI